MIARSSTCRCSSSTATPPPIADSALLSAKIVKRATLKVYEGARTGCARRSRSARECQAERYIDELSVMGLTSNPTIFDHAIKDGVGYDAAIRAFSREGMHAAHEVNGLRFAHAIVTTEELLARLPSSTPPAAASQTAWKGRCPWTGSFRSLTSL